MTYTNPVWSGYLADPFVLRHADLFYAYGTGPRPVDGRIFPVLRSPDLVHWELLGGALNPLDSSGTGDHWAPEVAERDGLFYLYYSAAGGPHDETHRLRVAVAERPEGPFADSGRLLLPDEGFTIDAHPFRDPADGRWFLFFAKDFFDGRVGTGLAAVPLSDDMVRAAGPVTTILRPSADWQIFERDRLIYGRTWDAWHTVEGPYVLRHEGRYYCLYSGGRWESSEYGLGVAVADQVLGPYHEAPDLPRPSVLRGVPGRVLGPGHNSVVRGPDGRTDYVVYHAWDTAQTARRMCIDPLVWTAAGPVCAGPTWTPQPMAET